MITFLIVMAVIPWGFIFMATYLLYRRVKPQLQLLWATAKMAWAAQRAAQAIHVPQVDCAELNAQADANFARLRQQLEDHKKEQGFSLIDSDYVSKKIGNA